MTQKAIFLVILAILLLPFAILADDASKLPSRNASVVLPLLTFSPQESVKDVLDQITKVLGQPDSESVSDRPGKLRDAKRYQLDNKSEIIVIETQLHEQTVVLSVPGQNWKQLYPRLDH